MISIGVIHFATCGAEHLRRSLESVRHQLVGFVAGTVSEILIYDNNSGTAPVEIEEVIDDVLGDCGVTVKVVFDFHGDPNKTHPYSVNQTIALLTGPWIFLTRSDYILAPDALEKMWQSARALEFDGYKPFVSGWCYQAAYNRQEKPYPPYNIEGLSFWDLIHPAKVVGHTFTETDQDAGVWLSKKEYWEACPLNEQLSAWGYSQSTWQRRLRNEHGIEMYAFPRELFFHQQHGDWARDHELARQQYEMFGEGR